MKNSSSDDDEEEGLLRAAPSRWRCDDPTALAPAGTSAFSVALANLRTFIDLWRGSTTDEVLVLDSLLSILSRKGKKGGQEEGFLIFWARSNKAKAVEVEYVFTVHVGDGYRRRGEG